MPRIASRARLASALALAPAVALALAACGSAAPGRPVSAAAPASDATEPAPGAPIALPIAMVEGRFFLETRTADGQQLRIFLDSAGGMFLAKRAADRLKLAIEREQEGEREIETAELPALADPRIPRPALARFPVLEDSRRDLDAGDGMFGAPWFAGRVVTFDYAAGKLWLRAPGDLPAVPAAHRIQVGLPRDASGAPSSPYGRIQMQVAGESIDMLLDTGATVALTPAALGQLGGTAVHRATSFITESVFARWRAAHPAWRVIDAADQTVAGAPMIEVPEVTIAGHRVGPVWFTRRPDRAFHVWMAQWMDQPTEGALGGSAFGHFARVTVDWPGAVAVFEK
ncbi:MAG: hypothetical protein ACTHU0_37740 [Kofleriaceae bacterium]